MRDFLVKDFLNVVARCRADQRCPAVPIKHGEESGQNIGGKDRAIAYLNIILLVDDFPGIMVNEIINSIGGVEVEAAIFIGGYRVIERATAVRRERRQHPRIGVDIHVHIGNGHLKLGDKLIDRIGVAAHRLPPRLVTVTVTS